MGDVFDDVVAVGVLPLRDGVVVVVEQVDRFLGRVVGIGDHTGQGGRGRRLRADEVNLFLSSARSAGEIAGYGAETDLVGGRGLSHADAAQASRFVDAGRGHKEHEGPPHPGDILDHLPAPGVDMKGGARMGVPAFHDPGRHHEVPKG